MNNIKNRINQLEKYLYKNNYKINENNSLAQINIVLSRICERSCYFCPNSNKEKIKEINKEKGLYMEMKTFYKIIKECQENNFNGTFSLAGFGEPTNNPNIKKIIKEIIKFCPNATVNLITNGDNENIIKEIAEESPKVLFTFSEYSEKDTERNKRLYSHIINKKNKKMYTQENLKNVNNRAGNVFTNKENLNKNNICYIPFFKITIDINGDVLICDNDWFGKYPYENIMDKKIYKIWKEYSSEIKKEMATKNRSSVNLCKNCDADGRLYGKEFLDFFKENYINEYTKKN